MHQQINQNINQSINQSINPSINISINTSPGEDHKKQDFIIRSRTFLNKSINIWRRLFCLLRLQGIQQNIYAAWLMPPWAQGQWVHLVRLLLGILPPTRRGGRASNRHRVELAPELGIEDSPVPPDPRDVPLPFQRPVQAGPLDYD